MAKDETRDAATRAYQQALKDTRVAVRMQVEKHYRAMPDLRDENAKAFQEKAVRIVQAGQQRAIALTNAHFSGRVGLAKPTPLNTDKIIANIRKGIPAQTVYERPIYTARASIEKLGFAKAFEKGLARLLSTADMDVAMAARDASLNFAQSEETVVGFVRVSEPSCCDYCQMIDGAKVYVDDPAPLHNNCGCTLEPITRTSGSTRENWTDVSDGAVIEDVEIREHGEMGPLITRKGDDFESVDDLPASYREQLDA